MGGKCIFKHREWNHYSLIQKSLSQASCLHWEGNKKIVFKVGNYEFWFLIQYFKKAGIMTSLYTAPQRRTYFNSRLQGLSRRKEVVWEESLGVNTFQVILERQPLNFPISISNFAFIYHFPLFTWVKELEFNQVNDGTSAFLFSPKENNL